MSKQVAGGSALRQTVTEGAPIAAAFGSYASQSPSGGRILLSDDEGAALYGVGLRTFLELQREPWFPRPVMLGPRMKRHLRSELEAAVSSMPRPPRPAEPAQLLRGKIERLKRAGRAA